MVDFGKRLAGKAVIKPVDPLDIYDKLHRAHDKGSATAIPGGGASRVELAGFAGGQDGALDPDDLVARFPRAGDRQGGSRGTPAARLWSHASRRPADGLAGSVARARTSGTRAGRNEQSTLARWSSGDRMTTPIRTGSKCSGSNPRAVRNRVRRAPRKQQPRKRNFAARDFRPQVPPMSRRDGGMDMADRLLPPQVAEMSCLSRD
jgi:hypothetical protein